MGIRGYLTNVRRCYREESFTDATAWAVHELKNSIVYRTLGDNIGESVWDKDWDVLVVLDACRVDMMEEIADAYGFDVDTHLSRASESPDWIRREIERSEAGVGYVTANPFTHDERVGISEGDDVGYLDEVWKDKTETRNGVTTVFPDSVTDRALWAHNTQDLDRLVIHYMQPHQPFIGYPELATLDLVEDQETTDLLNKNSIWHCTRSGRFDRDEVWKAYMSNLTCVLDEISERLIPGLSGDVVLTADHGNALGEWGEWGHPRGSVNPKIRLVPWVQVQGGDRDISGESPPADGNESEVESRLRALGYK